jgi:hypothetical protein
LRLLVDEDAQAHALVRLLRDAGHDVATVAELGLNGAPDDAVLARAALDARVLLTRNCGDFLLLHEASPAHSGVLAVYQDDDPGKDMSYEDIAGAVGRFEAGTLPADGQFVALNAWRAPTGAAGPRTRPRGRAYRRTQGSTSEARHPRTEAIRALAGVGQVMRTGAWCFGLTQGGGRWHRSEPAICTPLLSTWKGQCFA